jgi:hypothetical protein
MKLTQQDKARLLGITPMTLRNWRKHKPYLYAIIEKGFAFEDMRDRAKSNYENLEELDKELNLLIEKK